MYTVDIVLTDKLTKETQRKRSAKRWPTKAAVMCDPIVQESQQEIQRQNDLQGKLGRECCSAKLEIVKL